MTYLKTVQDAIDWSRPHYEGACPNYTDEHIIPVLNEVMKYTSEEKVLIAAFLHDAAEDTSITLQQICDRYDFEVSMLVDCVTDAEGPNRKARKMMTYHKTRLDPRAVLIKVCDRIQNLKRALSQGENPRFARMYAQEDYTFKCSLWNPLLWAEAWNEYNALIQQARMYTDNSQIAA